MKNKSSGKWSNLEQIKHKIKKNIKSKIFKTIKNFYNFFNTSRLILETSLIVLGSLKRPNSYFLCVK